MLYIVEVIDDGEKYPYEYSNIDHAEEHYNNEKTAILLEYKNGEHYLIKCK